MPPTRTSNRLSRLAANHVNLRSDELCSMLGIDPQAPPPGLDEVRDLIRSLSGELMRNRMSDVLEPETPKRRPKHPPQPQVSARAPRRLR